MQNFVIVTHYNNISKSSLLSNEELVKTEIHKKYKKATVEEVVNVNSEHKQTAVELDLDDRIFKTAPRDAFITLKDHKEDFSTNPKVRMINPTKPEVGRIAMKIVDNIVKQVRAKNATLKQAISTGEVIEWFKAIENKKNLKFINWDLDNFYASITPKILDQALDWAAEYVGITAQERKVVKQSCQSFLYFGGQPWRKKGDDNFDVGMGAYHGAQICEVVGLFLMSRLAHIKDLSAIIYRDDVLAVTRATSRQQEKMRQAIVKVFSEHGFGITIFINLKRVDFLDITLDLEKGTFKPYRKPGDRPRYVHSQSNHPPQVIKNIPAGIERRLVQNSCNEEVFLEAIPDYQAELDRCGYAYKLSYRQPMVPATQPRKRKNRSKRVTWFNPPFSLDVATNVAKEVLELVDKHFPPGHVLHSICNRSTIKVSYRSLPNIKTIIGKHNSKLLRSAATTNSRPKAVCNCQKKEDCPVPGKCNQNGVVYQATVTSATGRVETYVGLAKNFKKRYPKHKKCMLDESAEGQTALTNYYWQEKNAGKDPKISWKFLETNVPIFNPITNRCRLCLREKFNIVLKPNLASLNSRQEIFAHCRHLQFETLHAAPD